MCNETRKPHVHAELIKAWADGAIIESSVNKQYWYVANPPKWTEDIYYRIQPEPKSDVVRYIRCIDQDMMGNLRNTLEEVRQFIQDSDSGLLRLIYDGETGKLKSANVIN